MTEPVSVMEARLDSGGGSHKRASLQQRSLEHAIFDIVGHTIADVERELILQTLKQCHGNRTSAASMLGISVRTMRNKLRLFQADGTTIPPCMIRY